MSATDEGDEVGAEGASHPRESAAFAGEAVLWLWVLGALGHYYHRMGFTDFILGLFK